MSKLIDTLLDAAGDIVLVRNDVELGRVDAAGNVTTKGSVNGGSLPALLAEAVGVLPNVTSPTHLRRWHAAQADALYAQIRANIQGDSITAGAYANNAVTALAADQLLWAQRGYVGQFRSWLALRYGSAGEGWIGFGSDEGRWTYTGTTTTSAAGPVVCGRQINAGGQAAATALGPFTAIDVLGYHGTGTPPLTLFVDAADKTPTLMTATQETLAVGASDWANRANTTLLHGTDGSSENKIDATSAAAGNMSFQTPITVGNGLACNPGDQFVVGAEINSAVSSRLWRVGMIFFQSNGTQISELTTVDVTSSTVGSYQTKSNLITAPALTAYAAVIVRVDSAAAASEVHTIRRVRAIPVTAVVGQGGATLWRATRTGFSAATHDITIKGATTGNILTGGIFLKNGSTGVVVSRIGKSGTTTANHAGTDQSASTQTNMLIVNFDLLVPNLQIICLGANDAPNQGSNGITPTVYRANLKILTDKVTGVGGCTLLIAGPRPAVASSPFTESDYYAQAKDLATTDDHVAYIDLMDVWTSEATAETLGYQNSSLYGIHPTRAGHGDIARILDRVLLGVHGTA